jgi:hypothetical protein
MSEPDDILAMLGPLPEPPDLPELPGLWDGWAESLAKVEEVFKAYTEPRQLPAILRHLSDRRRKTRKKSGGKIPKSPPSPSDSLG